MQVEVWLPKIGMAMQDAVIVSWLKKEGDAVAADEPLLEIETEKVVETINSPASGVLKQVIFPEGSTVDVGTVLAWIEVKAGEPTAAGAIPLEPTKIQQVKTEPLVEDATPQKTDTEPRLGKKLPVSRMRQTIARRMVESLATAAQLTLNTEVDVTDMVEKRDKNYKDKGITYTDILVYLVARIIEQYPMLNARLDGDQAEIAEAVHIGVAVALPEGLIVPVIRNANRLSLAEISAERKRLVDRVRSGTFTSEDVSGGTFTLTNLGTYGIDTFTPIINLPEVAILGVGRIVEKPAVVSGEIKIRSMMGLSLTIDHRVIDGAPGAEFLKAVGNALAAADF